MARSKSSSRWLKEHFDDEFVRRSQVEGYRSRAVYKLKEIDEKDKLIKPGMTIIDLGAAPGGWSQYAAETLKGKGRVLALDLLLIEPEIEGVEFIQGDFREDAVLAELMDLLNTDKADLVFSDMAPNMSGVKTVDVARAMYLAELTLELSKETLKPGGAMLVKLFQGEGFDVYLKSLRQQFGKVKMRKPKASRSRSKEIYALATGFKLL
ncbi:MAG: 23S rRNA (uridine(2552)-2'-O)-methyltransferase RlmE [Gammaproteobacteria bacterium]|nr:23S rRNA (uridine(2552)-2'-O)-methyltransferase RlmE [Gammaproteobacteria bacterium]